MYVQRFVALSLLVLTGCIDLEPRPVTSMGGQEGGDMGGASSQGDRGVQDQEVNTDMTIGPSEVCDIDQLSSEGTEDCVISTTLMIDSGTYRFNTLKITGDGRLFVNPLSPDERSNCGGYSGQSDSGRPPKGGGCLKLIVNTLEVQGTISVSAENFGNSAINASGASGGDLLIVADHVLIQGGLLNASGSSGAAHTTESQQIPVGGGAAGRIQIRAKAIKVEEGGRIQAAGGQGEAGGGEGSGPGGGGGSGGDGGLGGAGAGGPGDGAQGGAGDVAGRPLEISGGLKVISPSYWSLQDGSGQPQGAITLGGGAVAYKALFADVNQDGLTVNPLALRVQDQSGAPLRDVEVTLSMIETETLYPLGATGEDGWLIAQDFSLAEFERSAGPYTLSLGISDLTELAPTLLFSYGHPDEMTQCTQELSMINQGDVVLNLDDCEREAQ